MAHSQSVEAISVPTILVSSPVETAILASSDKPSRDKLKYDKELNNNLNLKHRRSCPHCEKLVFFVKKHHSAYHEDIPLHYDDYVPCLVLLPAQFHCHICGMDFGHRNVLAKHIQTDHSAAVAAVYAAMPCEQSAPVEHDHLQEEGDSIPMDNVQEVSVCKFCDDFVSTSDVGMKNHLECVHSDVRRTCPKCCFVFKASYLFDHIKICKFQNSKIRCSLCGDAYDLSGNTHEAIFTHMHYHGRSDFCTICQKFFGDEAGLRAHLSVHETVTFQHIPDVIAMPDDVIISSSPQNPNPEFVEVKQVVGHPYSAENMPATGCRNIPEASYPMITPQYSPQETEEKHPPTNLTEAGFRSEDTEPDSAPGGSFGNPSVSDMQEKVARIKDETVVADCTAASAPGSEDGSVSRANTWVKLEAVDDTDDASEDEDEEFEDCWMMGNPPVGSGQRSRRGVRVRPETSFSGSYGIRDCYVRLTDIMKCPSMVKSSTRKESRKRTSESQPDSAAKANCTSSRGGGLWGNVGESSADRNSCEESLDRPYRLRSDRQRSIQEEERTIHDYKRRKVLSEQPMELQALLHIPRIPSLPRVSGKVCPICNLSFHSASLANMHVLSRHCRKLLNQSAELPCPRCEELLDGPLSLYGHVVFVHYGNPHIADAARWRWLYKLERLGVEKADEMDFDFDDKKSNVQEMMCPLCGGCAWNFEQLLDHILSVHWAFLTENLVYCGVCGQETSGSVHDHIRQIHPSKLHSFERSIAALAYTSQNIGSTNFVAVKRLSKQSKETSTGFSQGRKNEESQLKARGEGNVRSTMCLLCGKEYSQPSLLERHISDVHSNKGKDGGFHCHACDMSFTQYIMLYKHIRQAHRCDQKRSESPGSECENHVASDAARLTDDGIPRSDQCPELLDDSLEIGVAQSSYKEPSIGEARSFPQEPAIGEVQSCSKEPTLGEASDSTQKPITIGKCRGSSRKPTTIENKRDCAEEARTDQKGSKNRPLISQCPLCQKFHLSISKVNDHIVSAHSLQLTGKQSFFKCPLCALIDRNFPSVYMHVRIAHASSISERELTKAFTNLCRVRESGSYQYVLSLARQYSKNTPQATQLHLQENRFTNKKTASQTRKPLHKQKTRFTNKKTASQARKPLHKQENRFTSNKPAPQLNMR